MAIRFVTVAEARVVSGISSTLISDNDMTELIEDIEYQVESYLNCNLTPASEIDSSDGNAKPTSFTNRAPLLSLRELRINDVDVDITTVDFKKSGYIRLLFENGATEATFSRFRKKVFIRYVHGRVAWDKLTETTSTAALAVGTSVNIAVASETGFAVNDWIEIKSMDGNIEAARITATSSNQITVDELVFAHETSALIRLLKIDLKILRMIKVLVAIAAITRAVGQSFDEITGYSINEFQVQKGEPFTQFREAIIRFDQQAKDLFSKIRPTPGIVI